MAITVTPDLPWFMRAMLDQRDRDSIDEGLAASVRAFFADYEDADSVVRCDPSFYRALEKLSEYGNEDIDELIERVEREITQATGRKFKEIV